jgi:hypothetical protein
MLSNIWLAFVDMLKEMLGILQETWPLFKDNLTVTLGIPAVLVIVPMALVGIPAGGIAFLVAITSPITKLPTIPALVVVGVVAGAFFAVVYNSIRVGWTKVLLELESGGEATFSDIKAGMPWFVNFVIVNLIIGTAIAAGSYCFIVPGIFVAVRAAYAPFLVVD